MYNNIIYIIYIITYILIVVCISVLHLGRHLVAWLHGYWNGNWQTTIHRGIYNDHIKFLVCFPLIDYVIVFVLINWFQSLPRGKVHYVTEEIV